MKNFAVKHFAKAALVAGGTVLATMAGPAQAQQQQQPQVPIEDVFNQSPQCLAFEHPDRNGFAFDHPELHRYDDALRAFSEALSAYSDWDEIRERLARLQRPLNGVCVNSYDNNSPITLDGQMGSIDINIRQQTPWGPALTEPGIVIENTDMLAHLATMAVAGNMSGAGLNSPVLAPDVSAFLNAVTRANGTAEAVLATIERGLDENRLDELQPLLFGNNAPFQNEIALLYQKAATAGTLSEEDRLEFKKAVVQSAMQDPALRARSFQGMGQAMQELARNGVDISELFAMVPENAMMAMRLQQHFGAIGGTTIDDKPLMQAYIDYWANNPNDPVAEMKEQFDQFRMFVGMQHQMRQQQEQEQEQSIPEAVRPVPMPEGQLTPGFRPSPVPN